MTKAKARGTNESDPAVELISLRAQLAALVEQQAAVAEVLKSISASGFDLDQVLQTVTEHATRLSGATQGILYRRDSGLLRFAAGFGPSEELMEFNRANPIAVGNRGTLSGRVAVEKRTIHLADVLQDPEFNYREAQRLGGFRAMLGVPLMSGDDVLGTLSLWRTEPVPFGDEHIAIVETFARQAAVAIQNVRLLVETKEALEQQTATSDVLKTISRSVFDLQAVFDVVVENATKLCRGDWGYLFRKEGDVFQIIASHGGTPALLEYERSHPTSITDRTLIGRVALRRAVVHIPDLFEDADYDWPSNREHGVHTVLGVPILRDDEVIGAIGVARNERLPFSDAEIRLVQTFADQATIAMENVRLFNETKESLGQQTALSDVLRTISRSAFDLDAVLQTIVERATALGGSETSSIFGRDGDDFVVLAQFGPVLPAGTGRGTRIPITDTTIVGRALLTGRRQYVADAALDPSLPHDGPRTRLSIPLLRDGKAVGVLGVTHAEVRPFSDREMQMLETFADQAAIAIENVRLFNETKESLERQTALTEILRVIADSPADQQPVVDAIARSATRYCGAEDAAVHLIEGDMLRRVAHHGRVPVVASAVQPIERSSVGGRAILERRTVHLADVESAEGEDFQGTRAKAAVTGHRGTLATPLLREGSAIGVILLRKNDASGFTPSQIQLVEAFADQAVIAIENVRLFNETKEALERQTATAGILEVISRSTSDLQPVLDTVVAHAERLCAADYSFVFLRGEGGLRIAAWSGGSPELVALEKKVAVQPGRQFLVGRVALEGRPVQIPDVLADPEYGWHEGQKVGGYRTMLGVPLFRGGEVAGVLGVFRNEVKPFTAGQIELLRIFADQSAIAIENVRLFDETKDALERQTATSSILGVISRSPADQQPTLDAIVESGARLCDADMAFIYVVEGRFFKLRAGHKVPPAFVEYTNDSPIPVVAHRGSLSGRVVAERRAVQIPDVLADPEYAYLEGQRLVGYRAMLNVPMFSKGELIGLIGLWRSAPVAFTTKQIDLMTTFADQAVIAIENTRLFNETKEALERQTALAEILSAISASPTETRPVFEAIARNAARYCAAEDAVLHLVDGSAFRPVAHFGPIGAMSPGYEWPVDRSTVSGRAIVDRAIVQVDDLQAADGEFPLGAAQARDFGYHSVVVAPLLRKGEPIGALLLRRLDTRPFATEQVDLLRAFADQAVISIENVRLFNETKEALERQTSISDVLQTIGRSAFDLQPVLDTVVERAVRLCDAHDGSISTLEDGAYRTRSYWSVGALPIAYIELMLREVHSPERASLVGRTALEGRVVQIADVLADPEYTFVDMQQAGGYRTVLGVPLLRDGIVIGVFALTRNEVRPFTERQIELVRTFADQAAIAIENTRLFAATKEALEQQTAVGEVLKTISRSAFDLQPVLDIVLNNAVRLAGADIGWLSRVEDEQFTTVAYSTEFPDSVREELVRQRAQGHIAGPWIPLGTGGGLMGFTLAEGRTVHLPDVKEDPELKGSVVARLTASRTVVGVPMLRDGRSIGGMVLARYQVRPFEEHELDLVQTFADQAAIAIENVRLFNETKEALERQTAISEVLRAISGSAFDIRPVMETVITNAARLSDADLAWMRRVDRDGQRLEAASYGRTNELANVLRSAMADSVKAFRTGDYEFAKGLMGRVILGRRKISLDDITRDPELYRHSFTARAAGARTVFAVPLLVDDKAVGMLIVARTSVRPFGDREVQLVETFAQQAAIAMQNVSLFNEIQDKSQLLEIASRHKSEFLANMSHELRTPLNAIIGFSEVLLQGLFGEVNEKQREYLADVLGSGQHLLSLINDILDLSKIEAGRMDLELSTFRFRDALDSGLTIVRERAARHAIQLNAVVAPDVGALEADERKVKQILYNLLSNAVKFTPDGGRVDVSVSSDNGDVRVEVRDTGIGVASEDQARIFEEFRQVGRERSREGTGLGLTLTKRFVELHGGRIWVESTPGQGSTFTFTLPMRRAAAVGT